MNIECWKDVIIIDSFNLSKENITSKTHPKMVQLSIYCKRLSCEDDLVRVFAVDLIQLYIQDKKYTIPDGFCLVYKNSTSNQ